MKAISIWQPWASLLACGAKTYETRSWTTNYRGLIAIHAAKLSAFKAIKNVNNNTLSAMRQVMKDVGILTPSTDFRVLPYGCIIATAELVECWEVKNLHRFLGDSDLQLVAPNGNYKSWAENCANEILFGDFTAGRYAWEFANLKILDKPISARGRQGLWNWDELEQRLEVGE